MTDASISLKQTRINSGDVGTNVIAHKKKLAPITINSTPTEEKKHKLTNSGSLIEDEMIITKEGIKMQNPRTYNEMANEMNNLSLSNEMDIQNQSQYSQMSIQSDNLKDLNGMSIQSDYMNINGGGSKMSIQSMNSDLNKTKTKTPYTQGQGQETFKVPQPKGMAGIPGVSFNTNDSSKSGMSIEGSTKKQIGKNIVQNFFEDEKTNDSRKLNIKFDELKKVKMIGQGSQGSVDKMIHEPSGTPIALKSVMLTTDEAFHKQLKLELATLRDCDSEYIVKCYSAFYNQGIVSIALEFMDIGSLSDVLREVGQISEVILGAITFQVLKGLEYLHKTMKVIHRDIKPSNLLINSEGQVKIADFGVSGKIESTLEYKNSWVGTVTYMSPERFGGDKYNHDTDIWSLGLTIVECALGRYPYPEPGSNIKSLSFFDLMEYISSKPAPTLPDGFSPEIKDFVSICLRKEGGTRSSASELLKHPFVKKYAKISTKNFREWLKHVFPMDKKI